MNPEEVKTMLVIITIVGFMVYVAGLLWPPRKDELRAWLLVLALGYSLIARWVGIPPFEM